MFDKEDKYFPIKQSPACPLKWTWSTLWLTEGTTNSCHRCLRVPLDLDNFDSFHNHPHKIKEREIMLSGKWPTVENGGSGKCQYCKKIEDAGGFSDRLHHREIPNQYPKELDEDETATSVTPRILEVFMNATCNLKCTYCNTRDSSQWRAEAKKFGTLKNIDGTDMNLYQPMSNHPNTRKFFEKTLEWIEKHGQHLRRLHLLGGEPFYQSELKEMLDVLKKIKNEHLELNIISNLMVKEEHYKDYIYQIKELVKNRNIGRFDLTASIDGWGPEAEYARTGLKCDHWERLFEFTVNEKWIWINTNQTITSLTVRSIPQLIEIIKKYRKINPKIAQHICMVTGRPWMHPNVYGKEFWREDLEKILNAMPEDNEKQKIAKKYMHGAFEQVQNIKPDMKEVKNLKFFLDTLDQRRGTNWKKIYPYLDI